MANPNPYQSPSSSRTDGSGIDADPTVPHSPYLAAALLGAASGAVVWFALFVVHGFHSSFGNSLTRLYGRDLQGANLDWMILLPICAIAGVFALVFATAVAAKTGIEFDRNFSCNAKLYAIIVGTSTLVIASVFAWITHTIGVESRGPLLLASGVTAIASFACVPAVLSSQ